MSVGNVFHNIPSTLTSEQLEVLSKGKGVTIERIISKGHTSPDTGWYQQSQHEFVLLLQGTAQLAFEDHIKDLEKGDYLTIPAGEKHKVSFTSSEPEAIWLTVYYD